MNIWVEYFRYDNAQVKDRRRNLEEGLVKDIHKRFCQSRDDAQRFAKSMLEQGYHVTIKQDGKY